VFARLTALVSGPGSGLWLDADTGYRWVWRDKAWRRYDAGIDDLWGTGPLSDADVEATWP
jgi:hypothetical protein